MSDEESKERLMLRTFDKTLNFLAGLGQAGHAKLVILPRQSGNKGATGPATSGVHLYICQRY
jgi:hypothetical protein